MAIKENLAGTTLVLILALVSSQSFSLVEGQTEITILPGAEFEIPEYNSTITFAVNGTCSQASLKNGAWEFTNLVLNNSLSRQKLNLTVSTRDSNVTITSYQETNTTFAGSPASTVRLRYVAAGKGSQTFNLHLNPLEGDFSVISDGVWIGLYDGWTISSDSSITITAGGRNVSISCYGNPRTFETFLNQPFYLQHSVIILTTIILTITVILAIILKVNSKKQAEKATWENKQAIKKNT